MAIQIGANISALRAQRALAQGAQKSASATERLASGLRINHASDDAAGLAIASSLNTQSVIAQQGSRNVNDTISMLDIADSALQSLKSLTVRMQELCEQANNGVYSGMQRQAMQREFQALAKEQNRIIDSTTFNGLTVLGQSSMDAEAGGSSLSLDLRARIAAGDGTFKSATVYATAFNTWDLRTGDVNGDGWTDVVASSYTNTNLNLRLNDQTGELLSNITIGLPDVAYSVRMDDLNNDAKLDIIVAHNSNRVSVLMGNGDGSFQAARSVAVASSSRDVTLGDLNGDGVKDIVTEDGALVSVNLGRGDGTFDSSITAPSIGSTRHAIVGDVNGDGFADVVTAGYPHRIAVYMGSGTGRLGTYTAYNYVGSGSSDPTSMNLVDVNNDNVADIVLSTHLDNYVRTIIGNSDGSFYGIDSPVGAPAHWGVVAADFNGDGNADLFGSGDGVNPNLWFGNGDGTFYADPNVVTGAASVAVADMNNDGVQDILFGSIGTYSVRRGQVTSTGVTAATHRLGRIGISDISIGTPLDARMSLKKLSDQSVFYDNLSSVIGAAQSRLSSELSNLSTSFLVAKEAEGRITDADIAQESAEVLRADIIQQAATAVLAQANQQPALALRLLGK